MASPQGSQYRNPSSWSIGSVDLEGRTFIGALIWPCSACGNRYAGRSSGSFKRVERNQKMRPITNHF